MAKGYLTTHVLDTARGIPAAGVRVTLYGITGNHHKKLAVTITNADGRTDEPVLPQGRLQAGLYELVFYAGEYFDQIGLAPENPRFLDEIPIRFGVSDPDAHYHVPLLLSPFGMATYKGS